MILIECYGLLNNNLFHFEGKEIVDKWPSMDGECKKQYGKCQHAEEFCNGTKTPDLCKGPKHRVCCEPGKSRTLLNA